MTEGALGVVEERRFGSGDLTIEGFVSTAGPLERPFRLEKPVKAVIYCCTIL